MLLNWNPSTSKHKCSSLHASMGLLLLVEAHVVPEFDIFLSSLDDIQQSISLREMKMSSCTIVGDMNDMIVKTAKIKIYPL